MLPGEKHAWYVFDSYGCTRLNVKTQTSCFGENDLKRERRDSKNHE